jgi:hypothetical protein
MSQCPILTTDECHAHDERISNQKSLDIYACPCNDCHGGKMKKRKVIYEHMLKFGHSGIIPFPQNYYPDRIQLHSMRDEEAPNIDEEATNIDE